MLWEGRIIYTNMEKVRKGKSMRALCAPQGAVSGPLPVLQILTLCKIGVNCSVYLRDNLLLLKGQV